MFWLSMSVPWESNYSMFLKSSFGSYHTLVLQHGMSLLSCAHTWYRGVSMVAVICGSIGHIQAAALSISDDTQVPTLNVLVPDVITTCHAGAAIHEKLTLKHSLWDWHFRDQIGVGYWGSQKYIMTVEFFGFVLFFFSKYHRLCFSSASRARMMQSDNLSCFRCHLLLCCHEHLMAERRLM